ncbi:MAG: hydroxymethylbilane synthase [Alphaproteobacteria bacterium]
MTSGSLRLPLRLGTRNSKLARRQTDLVCAALIAAAPELAAPDAITIIPMQSSGDWRPGQKETTIAMLGGNKGLFAKELEVALRDGRIDCAVHSAKDLETLIPDDLCLAAFPRRDDPRDAFISPLAAHPRDLPSGARIGTSSLRRAAQLLHVRPDIKVEPFRGNVDTRLRKLADGQVDATLLAYAGLMRLGIADAATAILSPEEMLPAVAQGALAIEIRRDDHALHHVLRRINDPVTETCVMIERTFLLHLNGSCRTPVAAMATLLPDGQIDFLALAAKPDGTMLKRHHQVWNSETAMAQAGALGRTMRQDLPVDLLCV